MKKLYTRTSTKFFYFLCILGLAFASFVHAGDYYIYQQPDGSLVISNSTPPPGSKIIKKQTLPEGPDQLMADPQIPQDQLGVDNRLANLERYVGELSQTLRAQNDLIGALQQGGGDNNVAVGVTQAPGVVATPPRRFVPRYPRNDLPHVQPRNNVPNSPQRRLERAG